MHINFKKVPMPMGGMALGLAALGILYKQVTVMYWLCGAAALFCLLLLVGRVITDFDGFKSDFANPIFASVSAAGLMAVMQLSTYVEPFAHFLAFIMWACAVVAHFSVMALVTKRFIFNFSLKNLFPTFFITYVGIIVASVTSPFFGMERLGQFTFWFGFIAYMILLVAITYRYVKIPAPEPARPLFCIYAAPMSLSLVGYISVFEHPSLLFVAGMAILAQLLLLLVLTRIPSLLALGFYPSFAAMTFPFVISATGLIKTTQLLAAFTSLNVGFLNVLISIEMMLAAVMVLYVFVRYLNWMGKNVFEVTALRAFFAKVNDSKVLDEE